MLKLKGNNLPWCVNMHPRDEVWMEDSVLRLKGAGGTKGEGTMTVQKLEEKINEEMHTLSLHFLGISVSKLMEWRDFLSSSGIMSL